MHYYLNIDYDSSFIHVEDEKIMDKTNYDILLKELKKKDVELLAVSKTHDTDKIKKVYDWGQRDFGENRVQELTSKAEKLPSDIRWHQIGPLQSNKIKDVVPYVSMIHSGTRMKVFRYVNKYAAKNDKIVDMLLQVHIADEDSKSGFEIDKIKDLCENKAFEDFDNVRIRGMMGMATFTEEFSQVEKEFKTLKKLYDECREKYFDYDEFDTLSMGMSGDYKIAVECGSTIVRVGSLIFGERNQ